jgi:non-specific serine/threonine protein kinase/serine/threonine-protein kinase
MKSHGSKGDLSSAQQGCIDALLDDLLDLPEDQRFERFLGLHIDDSAVAAEIESLLRAASASQDFLMRRPHRPTDVPHPALPLEAGLDRWKFVRLIGHGGMGDVYEAIRSGGDFDQRVAIKILQCEAADQSERFHAERQILARLEHPGIARLYDGGMTADARPYMVMEYVEGRPITHFCLLTAATLENRLKLFIQVCDAVAYAHQNLVVHRDLKPSNILVTQGGAVKLVDFGIAKLLDANSARVTQGGPAPMTPSCAAPEQLAGGVITTATDVYALGVLLFELLTGAHPWIETDMPVLQAMRAVLDRSAPVASEKAASNPLAPIPARRIGRDLDAIIAKALRREPVYRYATVDSLKLEIEHVLHGDPIEARKGVPLYVAGRLLRRYRWVAGTVGLTLVSALVALAWQSRQVAIERETARRESSREEAIRRNLTRLFDAALANPGTQALSTTSVIDKSAPGALRDLRERPELAGQTVLALADMYGALEDVSGATSLLEGFIAQSSARVDQAALADARQRLAAIELLRGQLGYAEQLLDQSDSYWKDSPRPYLEERLAGVVLRARLQRARGDLEASIDTSRQAIAQRVSLSGHNHPQTALLYNALAISLTEANRLEQALDAYHEAAAIYESLGLRDGLDAQITMANSGILELKMGHLQVAEVLLKSSSARERSLSGDSAALADALGYYGKVLLITGRNEPAISVLREAAGVASRSAGADSPLTLQNQIFLAEGMAATGDLAAANDTLNDVRVVALAKYGGTHSLTLSAQVGLAQIAAQDGAYDKAASKLTAAIAGLRHLGPAYETSLAHALEALGEVELRREHIQQASIALKEAVAIREKTFTDLWELARARERLGEALVRGHTEGAAELLERSTLDLESQLGASHPETIRAKAALALARA